MGFQDKFRNRKISKFVALSRKTWLRIIIIIIVIIIIIITNTIIIIIIITVIIIIIIINIRNKNTQNAIYDYFAENNGTVGGQSDDLKQQYGQLSKCQLKFCKMIQRTKEQYGISQNSYNQNILRNRLKSEITTQM